VSSKPAAPKSKRPPQGGQQRGGRANTRNLNRSEERALRVRAAATAAAQAAAQDDEPSPGSRPVDHAAVRRARRLVESRVNPANKIAALSRDQEYAIIRHDLRRLLTISAVLLVAMVALLLVLPT
jgi:hypothetical protein